MWNLRLDSIQAGDVFLWRNKIISASVLGIATGIWVLFELLECHLIPLLCYFLILSLATLFLWSNASTFINRLPLQIPKVVVPGKQVVEVPSALRIGINNTLSILHKIASGRDLKRCLAVIAGLWVVSVVGSWCNFLTLFYISFVLVLTLPVLFERHKEQCDSFREKASVEMKKLYAVLDAKVLSKIPRSLLKDKKD